MIDGIWLTVAEVWPLTWLNGRVVAIVLGVLFAALTIALMIASWTRWGQNRPITACVVMSLLAHFWLLMYAYGTRIIMPGDGPGSGGGRQQPAVVRLIQQEPDSYVSSPPSTSEEQSNAPLESPELIANSEQSIAQQNALDPSEADLLAPENASQPSLIEPALNQPQLALDVPALLPPPPPPPEAIEPQQVPEAENTLAVSNPSPTDHATEDATDDATANTTANTTANITDAQSLQPTSNTAVDQPVIANADVKSDLSSPDALPPPERLTQTPTPSSTSMSLMASRATPPKTSTDQMQRPLAVTTRAADRAPLPQTYQGRVSENRLQLAFQNGGDAQTEQAVEMALQFFANHQSFDGHWDAIANGAGRETRTFGEDRSGTGSKADTAMTGLAILAFLGAGYTHLNGPHAKTVESGLEYLISEQMPSGDLAGKKLIGKDKNVHFSRMYSHGIASFALAEAYAMTGDRRLLPALTKAAEYSLRAQNPRTGGWRYAPHYEAEFDDPGDLSQFGWQAMALNSCAHGGFTLSRETRSKLKLFLDSVSTGAHGGLAVYRPIRRVPGQAPSPAMTAEALASRLLLGFANSPEADQEAKNFLLSHLPGTEEANFYYWYYATIAMFQYQDQDWQVWNAAMKKQLLGSQSTSGEAAGAWEPTDLWGGYGGRIYSTAMACMCLEVYYRYLPSYQRAQIAQTPLRNGPR